MRPSGWFFLATLAAAPALADGVRVPLSIAIAHVDGGPVVEDAWLDEQLAHADRAFAPSGVCFEVAERRVLGPPHTALETRADRHALGALVERGRANVFVVASLRDVDDPSLLRMGVHWRSRGRFRRHFVIVAASAWQTTLAHELGHFFGNPHHPTPGNLMSYEGRVETSGFDAVQVRRIVARLRGLLRSREIVPRDERCGAADHASGL